MLAGDLAQANADVRAVAYLPATLPEGAAADQDPERYAEQHRTEGADLSVDEPLRYWADVIASGPPPFDVRVLAIGGGRISAAEYRLGLALGARVGAFRGSGGGAAELLRDPWWAATPRLVELAPDAEEIREFLSSELSLLSPRA